MKKEDWLDNLNLTIEKINKESVLKKEKVFEDDFGQAVIKKNKLNSYRKIEYIICGKFMDTSNYRFYSDRKQIFADFDFYVAQYFHKGANYPGRPLGEITEKLTYYKNENEGISLKRQIDYYENSNIDSLIRVLKNMNFDTTLVGNDEYLVTKRSFKKIGRRLN